MKMILSACVLAISLAACGGQSPVQSEHAGKPEPAPRFTVEVTGQGPDVILIPGLASHPLSFATTIDQLEDRYTLHAVHVAGFAGAPAGGNAGQDDVLVPLSADIAAYAQSLDQPPAVIGHSLGGLTALVAALDTPTAFERVMVIDVLPFFSVLIDPNATPQTIAPTATFMKAGLLGQSDELYATRQREGLSALTKSQEALEDSMVWSLATDRTVMAEAMHDVLTTDLRGRMAQFTVPLTVLYARDPAVANMDRTEQQFIADYSPVPDVEIVPVDGSLHFVMYDQPEAYAAAVEKFLSD